MLIENTELTMSHLGLGNLNEYALLLLFGNAHSHHLTMNTGILPNQIKDNQGVTLYPAYFMTHLKVPVSSLLFSYGLWDKVSVGVEVTRFGDTLLDSSYILGREGEVAHNISNWDLNKFPSMTANSLIVVDASETACEARKVAIPKAECFAVLPKLSKPPEAILKSRNIRENGFGVKTSQLKTQTPIIYYVTSDQDAANGHAMVFAKYTKIMDYAEFTLLSRHLKPGLPSNIIARLSILEREIFYYGNCFSGETLEIYINGEIEACEPNYHGNSLQTISVALLTYQVEMYNQKNLSLLMMAKVKKLLAVPISSQDLIPDVRRIIKFIGNN